MANVGNVVRLIAVKATNEGFEELSGKLKETAAGMSGVAIETEKVSRGSISAAAAWKRQTLALDETARAQDKMAIATKNANNALAQGLTDQAGVTRHLGLMAVQVGLVSQASNRLTAGMSGLKVAAEAAASAVSKPLDALAAGMAKAGNFNAFASDRMVAGLTKAGDASTVAAQRIIAGMSGIKTAAAEAGASKPFGPLVTGMTAAGDVSAVASHKMVAGMSAMGKEAAAAAPQIEKVTVSQAALTKQSSRNAAEMLNLGRQAADVAVSLQAGQSILVVGLQQGAQIIDVIASSQRSMGQIFSQAAGWARGFITSTAGVVTGIAAIGAGAVMLASNWQEGQREIDRALIGIGQRAGTTKEDINKFAEASANSSRLSVSESRTAALEFVKTGNIYSENLAGLVGLVKGHSVMIGESAGEAAKQLAKMFGDENIGAVADNLSKMYTGISGATRQLAVDLDVAGKRQQALAVLVNAITPSIKEAADATGFWAKRWDELSKAVSKFGEGVGKVGAFVAPATEPQEQLEKKRGQLSVAEPALAQMREDAALMGRDLVPGLEQAEESVRSLQEAIVMLENQIISLKNAPEKARLEKLGKDADAVVNALVPFIGQLEVAEKALNKLKEARDAMAAGKNIDMGQAKFLEQSIAAGEVRVANTKSEMEMMARRNAYMMELLKTEQESVQAGGARAGQEASTNLQVLMQLDTLNRQLPVAQAVGQMAQIEAQHKQRVAELSITLDGSEARRIAGAERLVSLAQIEAQHKMTMIQLQGQLDVAKQVTGIGQINAQYGAMVNLLKEQMPLEMALEQAETQRATSIADANTQAQQMLHKLQQESQLIGDISESEKARIKGQQTYNDLIDKGVDSRLAEQVAAQQVSNEIRRIEEAERRAAEAAIAGIRSREDAWKAYTDGVISWSVANDEAAKANRRLGQEVQQTAVDLHNMTMRAEEAARGLANVLPFAYTVGGAPGGPYIEGKTAWKDFTSQFNPAGYQSMTTFSALMLTRVEALEASIGAQNVERKLVSIPGGESFMTAKRKDPFEGREKLSQEEIYGRFAETSYAQTGSAFGAAREMINKFASLQPQALQGSLNRLMELMTNEERIATLKTEIGKLSGEGQTLARDELLKNLNESLKELTEATEANTNAKADPLFSQGHDYLNKLKIGYYKAAEGGIFGPDGPIRLMPINRFADGGIATSPQMAMFGEGAGPEAFIPLKGGAVPVTIKSGNTASNDNSRNITQNIQINIEGGSTPTQRLTARQRAQGFVAAATRAAGG